MTWNRPLAWLMACAVIACPSTASADVTAFLGLAPSAVRMARGVAAGAGLVIVAFEVEAADIAENVRTGSPRLSTGMVNGLVQTPLPVSGMQFYGALGAGVYRETLGVRRETHVGGSIGGGVKIGVAGPLRLRLDYRLFRLQGAPLRATYHRIYAGANLGF